MYICCYVIFEHMCRMYLIIKGGPKLYLKKRMTLDITIATLSCLHILSIFIDIFFNCKEKVNRDNEPLVLALSVIATVMIGTIAIINPIIFIKAIGAMKKAQLHLSFRCKMVCLGSVI
jgi:hypothetical protein